MAEYPFPARFTIRAGSFSKDEKMARSIKADVLYVDRSTNAIQVKPQGSTRELTLQAVGTMPDIVFKGDIVEIDVSNKHILRTRMG